MTKIIPRMTSEAQRTGLSHLDRRVLVAHLQPMPLLFLDMYPTYWEVSNTTCTCTKNIGAFISWIPLLPPIYEDTDFTQLRIHFLALSPYILPPLSVRTDVSLLTKAVSIKKCAHPRFSIPIMLDFYLWYRHKGPSIKYVRTEGRGGSKNRPNLRTNSTGNADEGGGVSKMPKNLRTYLMDGP